MDKVDVLAYYSEDDSGSLFFFLSESGKVIGELTVDGKMRTAKGFEQTDEFPCDLDDIEQR